MRSNLFYLFTFISVILALLGFMTVPVSASDGGDMEMYESKPLTPEGNMSLVDDIDGKETSDKQFITVVTKNGAYFYIIIDRAEDGENTVHFLNQVDEADLLKLIDEEEIEIEPLVCTCKAKCVIGSINTYCSVCITTMKDCNGEEIEVESEKGNNSSVGLVIFTFVLILGGGAVFYYFKIYKSKQEEEDFIDEEDEYEELENDDTNENTVL